MALFAIWNGPIGAWGIADWAIFIIIAAGIVTTVTIILRKLEVKIPDWLVQLFWVCVVVLASL